MGDLAKKFKEMKPERRVPISQMSNVRRDPVPDPAHGEPVRLYSVLANEFVVLVFYRGGWCPYCNLHLRGFQRRLAQFHQLGAQVLAISPLLPDNSLSTQEKNALVFPMLGDVGNKLARQFGLVFELSNQLIELYRQFGHPMEIANGPAGRKELPVPGTFLIDRNGTSRLAHVDVDLHAPPGSR
jgi:peroxiredoxin